VVAVDEVHVRVSWRAKEHGVARSQTGVGVRGGIVCTEVGFALHDAARKQPPALSPDEQLAQQLASHRDRIAIEEFARKNWRSAQHRGRELTGEWRRLFDLSAVTLHLENQAVGLREQMRSASLLLAGQKQDSRPLYASEVTKTIYNHPS
jgi:hypothetical protein